MIAMTTSSSISVKPPRCRFRPGADMMDESSEEMGTGDQTSGPVSADRRHKDGGSSPLGTGKTRKTRRVRPTEPSGKSADSPFPSRQESKAAGILPDPA